MEIAYNEHFIYMISDMDGKGKKTSRELFLKMSNYF